MSDGARARYPAVAINDSANAVNIIVRFFILCITTQAQRRPRRRGWRARCALEFPRRSNERRGGRSLQRMVSPLVSHTQSGLNSTLTTLPLESETIPQSELNAPSLECRKISESRMTISPDADVVVEYCDPLPTSVNVLDVFVEVS